MRRGDDLATFGDSRTANMTPEEAERLAIPFGLTYLSREGYEKLALLLQWVIDREVKRLQAPEHLRGVAGWRVG